MNADVVTRLFDGPDQRRGMALELPARRRQRGARLVAHEQRAAELLFKRVDTRADGGLADMESIRGGDEIARGHHRQECPGQFGVHGSQILQSTMSISKASVPLMSKLPPPAH